MADTTLTHKLRNPKSYNQWMDIWTATVHDPESQGASPKYEITPSENWKISPNVLDEIPVNKIESVTSTETIGGETKNYTTTNVTIKSEPVNDTLGLNGNSIAITNTDGSIKEGAQINSSNNTKVLDGTGNWVAGYGKSILRGQLYGDVSNGKASQANIVLTQNKLNDETDHTNTIRIAATKADPTDPNTRIPNKIKFEIASNVGPVNTQDILYVNLDPLETEDIANEAITPNKIDWGDPTNPTDPMSENLRTSIGLNSSTNNGIVPATGGTDNVGKMWSVGSNGEPNWNNFSKEQWNSAENESLTTSKIDTKLLGAWIDEKNCPLDNSWTIKSNDPNCWTYQDDPNPTTYVVGTDEYTFSFQQSVSIALSEDKITYTYTVPSWGIQTTEIPLEKVNYNNIISAYDLGTKFEDFLWNAIEKDADYPSRTGYIQRSSTFKYSYANIIKNNFETYSNSYPIKIYKFSDWDWKHLGIWIEI